MSTSGYLLNLGLVAWVLATNLGTRTVTLLRLFLPLGVVVGVAATFLDHVPTLGNDVALEAVLGASGVLLGLACGLAVRVRRERGVLVMRAGAAYAALWIAAIGGRMAFAYGADHWFGRQIALFSRQHLITGADAWTAGFVLMALAMVVTRIGVTALRVALLARSRRAVPVAA